MYAGQDAINIIYSPEDGEDDGPIRVLNGRYKGFPFYMAYCTK